MITLKNILVAVDFSEPSDNALAYGRELARTFGGTLHVLHAVGSVVAATLGMDSYTADLVSLQHELEQSARRQLDALVGDEDRRLLSAKTVIQTSSSAAAAIVDYAKDARIDLIVLGTHGRGGMTHLLMGSVAERVVRTAPCPVLTVRTPEHEFVLPDALEALVRA